MEKITFARIGNYTPFLKIFLEELGFEVVLPEKTTSKIIAEGSKNSPEMFCFPFKVNMGSYLLALEKGIGKIFMVTSNCGSCRLRYYAQVSQKILEEKNFPVDFVIFDQNFLDIIQKLKKMTKKSSFKILSLLLGFLKEIRFVEKLERMTFFLRPREINKGETDKILDDFFSRLEKLKGVDNLKKEKKEVLNKILKVKYQKKEVPKVGIVGEIYTVIDPEVNFQVEKKLGNFGLEVHRDMTLSYHLLKKIFFTDFFIQRKIDHYLKSTVGGHGRDAVFEMLKYSKKNFSGIVQLLPFSCMPEVTIRPILLKIHQETNIPFLSLSFDEQTAEAGLETRLEAFVDVVNSYFEARIKK
ncbi:MAG: acyl-CoA dehydratase activase-related protein [Minisyncoccales bacterium]